MSSIVPTELTDAHWQALHELAVEAMTHAYAVGRKFTVAALAYLTVVFSTLAGIFFFGEQIGWQEWLGIGIIIASGILSGLKK